MARRLGRGQDTDLERVRKGKGRGKKVGKGGRILSLARES